MTERLYEADSYLKVFEAKCIGTTSKNGHFFVALDKTAFFPNQGGQSCDKGFINGIPVLNVEITNGIILHEITEEIPTGDKVLGVVDFEHRFRNMQMHSGEHIFSGMVHNTYGYNNVGFHLSDNSATMDFDGKLTLEQVNDIEDKVNRVIFENRKIKAYIPSSDELEKIDYRSKKELEGDVRLVEIEGVDTCACCAPHVSLTGEIGFFKVVNVQNYKTGVRIDYLCGLRALELIRTWALNLNLASKLLSSKPGEEVRAIEALLDDNRKLHSELFEAKKKQIDSMIDTSNSANDMRCLFLPKDMIDLMKYATEAMHANFGSEVAVFAGDDEAGYRYLIESKLRNLTEITEKMRSMFAAKGGGRPDSIQGNVMASHDAILTMF